MADEAGPSGTSFPPEPGLTKLLKQLCGWGGRHRRCCDRRCSCALWQAAGGTGEPGTAPKLAIPARDQRRPPRRADMTEPSRKLSSTEIIDEISRTRARLSHRLAVLDREYALRHL